MFPRSRVPFVLALAPAIFAQRIPDLVATVSQADSIAIVKVAARHRIPTSGDGADLVVVECEVERRLFGVPEGKLFVLGHGVGGARSTLEAGDRYLLFTVSESRHMLPLAREAVGRLIGDLPLQRSAGTPWPIGKTGELEVPEGVELHPKLPVTAGRVAIEPAAVWIRDRLVEQAWRVNGIHATLGPTMWTSVVHPNGSWKSGGEPGVLTKAEHLALRRAMERVASPDIPDVVGRSKGPESAFLMIVVRTDVMLRRIRVHPPHPEDPPEVEEQRRIALDVWEKLPGAGRPGLPGGRGGRPQ